MTRLSDMPDETLINYAEITHKVLDQSDKALIDELTKRLKDKCRLVNGKVVSINRDKL